MKPPTAALGIDLACRRWNDIGSALIAFDRQRFTEAVPGAITWPTSDLTPSAVAGAIDAFARAHDIAAVSIDGPQGWRDPVAPSGRKGVGRAREYATRTPGKTGTRGIAYPSTFLRWIRFSIEVFADLLDRPDVALLNEPGRCCRGVREASRGGLLSPGPRDNAQPRPSPGRRRRAAGRRIARWSGARARSRRTRALDGRGARRRTYLGRSAGRWNAPCPIPAQSG